MLVKTISGQYVDTSSGSTIRVQQTEEGTARVVLFGTVFGSNEFILAEFETLEDGQTALDDFMGDQEVNEFPTSGEEDE